VVARDPPEITVFPDFIGIGAQKAGTTWLARNLAAHPQIWMPPIKEIHYFDRPSDWRDPVKLRAKERNLWDVLREIRWANSYNKLPRNDRWYASLFKPGKRQIAGEITPAYAVLDVTTIRHVHTLMPGAKVIFFLRNPVERMWSQAVMYFDRQGRRAEAASSSELRKHFGLERVLSRTDYLRTIENWSRFYDQERIFLGFMEDIHFHPQALLKRLYAFLGVDPTFSRPSDTGRRVHSRSSGSMPAATARFLAELYREDLERLQELFGGYASFWLYCADSLLSKTCGKEEEVAYPFWGTSLWENWSRGPDGRCVGRGPQSERLSQFRA
jgi:hypothetical protein